MDRIIGNNKKDYKFLRQKFEENHEKIVGFVSNYNEAFIDKIYYLNSNYDLNTLDSFNDSICNEIKNISLNMKERLNFAIGGTILILYNYKGDTYPCCFNASDYHLKIENDYVYSRIYSFGLLNYHKNNTYPFDSVCSNMFEMHSQQKKHWARAGFPINTTLEGKSFDKILKQYYKFFSNIIISESININNEIDKKIISDYSALYELEHDVNLQLNLKPVNVILNKKNTL